MTITAADDEGHMGTAQTQFIVERARKHALDETVVRKQVDRLGNTEFSLESLLLTCDDNVMVPMSEINEARRLAVEALTKARLEDFFARPAKRFNGVTAILSQPVNHSLRRHAELSVHVDTLDKAKAALSGGADVLIVGGDSFTLPLLTLKDLETLGGWVREKGKKWYIGTSRIVSEGQLSYYDQVLPRWQALSPDGIVVSNNGLVEKVLAQGLPLWVDWNQNTFNSQSILFWHGTWR